jgi:hypothetical protein
MKWLASKLNVKPKSKNDASNANLPLPNHLRRLSMWLLAVVKLKALNLPSPIVPLVDSVPEALPVVVPMSLLLVVLVPALVKTVVLALVMIVVVALVKIVVVALVMTVVLALVMTVVLALVMTVVLVLVMTVGKVIVGTVIVGTVIVDLVVDSVLIVIPAVLGDEPNWSKAYTNFYSHIPLLPRSYISIMYLRIVPPSFFYYYSSLLLIIVSPHYNIYLFSLLSHSPLPFLLVGLCF